MTVNSRKGTKSNSDLLRRALFLLRLLSDLISAQDGLTRTIALVRTVWHPGCPKPRCEGLRVLETWIDSGWGLGITEIGRTGISSPRNKAQTWLSGNPSADNSEGNQAGGVEHHRVRLFYPDVRPDVLLNEY